TDLTALQLASVALNATATVVWGALAHRWWETCRRFRPRNPLFRLLRNLATLGALHYATEVVVCLVPPAIAEPTPPPWLIAVYILDEWTLALLGPVAWHLVHYWGGEIDPPGRAKRGLAYGSAMALMILGAFFPTLLRGLDDPLLAYIMIRNAYLVVVFGL